MLHVLATVEIESGNREAFLAVFAKLVPLVRAEDGCLEYGAAVDVPTSIPVQVSPRPDVVMVVEKWASLDALEAHLKAPHMVEYRQRVKAFVKQVSLQILRPA
jgi:quinol monooxygenase YgiN